MGGIDNGKEERRKHHEGKEKGDSKGILVWE